MTQRQINVKILSNTQNQWWWCWTSTKGWRPSSFSSILVSQHSFIYSNICNYLDEAAVVTMFMSMFLQKGRLWWKPHRVFPLSARRSVLASFSELFWFLSPVSLRFTLFILAAPISICFQLTVPTQRQMPDRQSYEHSEAFSSKRDRYFHQELVRPKESKTKETNKLK